MFRVSIASVAFQTV